MIDMEKEMKDFGLLGRFDSTNDASMNGLPNSNQQEGITDKIMGSLVNTLMKSLDKQFREIERTGGTNMPNGIRIKVGIPQKKQQKQKAVQREVTEEQIKKMSGLPRAAAKTNIRRLSDKLIYELSTPGVLSTNDVFVSRTESGYEIKAIGEKKVYINSLPVNLPIKGFALDTSSNKLFVEFKSQE